MAGYRLPRGGTRIDRTRPLRFTFDGSAGRRLCRRHGRLGAARLRAARSSPARSSIIARAASIPPAPEEPNALVTLGDGAATEPNAKATIVEAADGLAVRSQNAWPSLATDFGAVNGLFSPFFAAGFYYKTFIGPFRGAWMLYEPFIRRAAGLGKASFEPDPDRYETAHAFCDVLVVGGGPAGLSAALAAGRAGARVILCDDSPVLGGALDLEDAIAGGDPADWLFATIVGARARCRMCACSRAPASTAITTTTCSARSSRSRRPRRRDATAPAALAHPGAARRARGRRDRAALRLPRQRHAGRDAGRRGARLCAPLRRRGRARGRGLHQQRQRLAARRRAVARRRAGPRRRRSARGGAGAARRRACGDRHGVPDRPCRHGRARRQDAEVGPRRGLRRSDRRTSPGAARELACDALLVSAGWNPLVHLASQAGGPPVYDEAIAAFLPGEPREAWVAAGAMRGTFDAEAAAAEGAQAGAEAARALGFGCAPKRRPDAGPPAQPAHGDNLLPLFEIPAKGKAFVDLQNDVTASDVRLARREGFESVEHLKRYTTLGMAADQGKTSNLNGLTILAEARGLPIPAVGTTRFRPPYNPVSLGALAGRARGGHLAAAPPHAAARLARQGRRAR